MPNPQTVRLATHAVFLDDDGKDIAENVTYDPTASGLTATDVQAAIDEVAGMTGTPDLDAVLAVSTGQDIADALTGAASPDAGNVFATIADIGTIGRWELAVITGSPPDPLYADGDFLYILVP